MNTYNENLQNTVINTLNGIYLQQQNLASAQTTAEYTLYHAQGAEITARDKLEHTAVQIRAWENINNQAVINNNQMSNLLGTATDIGKLAATSMSNASTAAANVQIASNAISLLASDIGAALNVATASLFDTDVYNRIVQANSFINNVANDSRHIAKKAMETSANTSEIISTEVLALAKAGASKVGNVFKSTQPELDMFSALAITESQDVSAATVAERQAEGSLADANSALAAINNAYTQANNQLNMGLTITVLSGFEIQASFQALPSPLPTFSAPPASTIAIPQASPAYYLTLVPAQNAPIFFIDQATQLFQQASGAGSPTSGFLTVTPDLPNSPSYVDAVILLTNDAYGQPVLAGQGYVAYIYTELSLPYKQFINNFSDLLSAPSQPFTPATHLPGVQHVRVLAAAMPDPDGVTWTSLQFQAAPLALSADEAAQAAAADAAQANAANAAAQAAAESAASAAQNIGASASAAATALQTARTAATTAANDAAAEASAAQAAQAAQDQITMANQVAAAGTASSAAAVVASAAANGANTAFQNLLAARNAVAAAAPAPGAAASDGSGKGKGKPAAGANDKGAADPASQAKAQQAAQALASATEALSPAVANAESAAGDAAIAANNAAIVVTLLDPGKSPASDPAVRNLAVAMAVAAAANAAANTTAAASAAAAQASAAAAAASANGTMSAGDANSAALAAANAAQVSNTAANAAASANANVIVAQENLTSPQIEQAKQALLAAANIVAPAGPGAIPSNMQGTTTAGSGAVAPELAGAMVASATQATSAASAANNAVLVCSSTLPAFQFSAELALYAAAGDDPAPLAGQGQPATQQDYDNVNSAIAAVVTACQPVATSTTANAGGAASAAASVNSAAVSAVNAAAAAAATAAASAATAATAASTANSAAAAAANAITQADSAARKANQASASANAASAAAQASAALAAQAAAAPPASPGTILAAAAALRACPGYRCILVQVGGEPDLNFMVSPDGGSQAPIYFNLNIAEQVPAANYVAAAPVAIETAPAASAVPGFSNPIWEVTLDGSVTDNFGNPILPDIQYQPYILTVLGDGADASQFVNTLTTNIPPCMAGTSAAANTAAAGVAAPAAAPQ